MAAKPKAKGLMMYMPRDYVLITKKGITLKFVANKPRQVPPRAVDAAIAVGAVFEDKQEQRILVDEPAEIVEPAMGFEREQDIFNACAKLADENSPANFTPTGKPMLEAVKNVIGYDIDRKEVNEVWKKVLSARANA